MDNLERKTLNVIGLMSGTSVDGIDACLVKIKEDLSFEVCGSHFIEYSETVRKLIFSLFSTVISIKDLCCLNFVIAEYFAKCVNELLDKMKLNAKDVDLIGSHGQTVFHHPTDKSIDGVSLSSTLQIGDGSVIAQKTGITTVSDFRTADIAVGGEGAPLVCFADEVIFGKDKKARAIQNIGGMGNVTVVSPNCDTFAFDTGPGNVLIDYFAQKFFSQPFDKGAKLALQGTVNQKWLDELLKESYYFKAPPKTTGRELFSVQYAEKILETAPGNPYDVMATITELTAKVISDSYKMFVFPKTNIDEVVLGGGGALNPLLTTRLKHHIGLNIPVKTHEDFGIPNKLKEAIAFALLAYTSFYKIPNNVPVCTGAKKKVILGKIAQV